MSVPATARTPTLPPYGIVANNSNLETPFRVILEADRLRGEADVPRGSRISFAAILGLEEGEPVPLYLRLTVRMGDRDIETRDSLERNTFVALLGPKPRADVNFQLEGDLQPDEQALLERQNPKEEAIRAIAERIPIWLAHPNFPYFPYDKNNPLVFGMFMCCLNLDRQFIEHGFFRYRELEKAFHQVMRDLGSRSISE